MTPIANIDHYNSRMKKSLLDKTFFMQHIDATVYVDYGCADGSMIEFMSSIFPEYHFYGYDYDDNMIDIAKEKGIENAQFSTNLNWLLNIVKQHQNWGEKVALVLSSLIHEIYAYCDEDEIDTFWAIVLNSGFDYIVIRDMWVKPFGDNVDPDELDKIRKFADPIHLKEFEDIYGPITNRKNFIHFLLKYRYTDNWERELNENYLGVDIFSIENMAKDAGYENMYFEAFLLPYLKEQVEKDFNITLKDITHTKLIYRKKDGQ